MVARKSRARSRAARRPTPARAPIFKAQNGFYEIFADLCIYAQSLCRDDVATLDDLREAVTTLEDTARIARRVLGGAHPFTVHIERTLQNARSKLVSFEALSERMRDLSVS